MDVFANYHRELHRFLVRRLRGAQEAGDLMQEVYLRLLRTERSELIREPRAYIYGIASHVVHEFCMRSRRDRVMYDSVALERLDNEGAYADHSGLAEHLGAQQLFERALSRLPPIRRAVFLLSKRDGLSLEEVAERLNLSAHTVKKYLFQAMAQIGLTITE